MTKNNTVHEPVMFKYWDVSTSHISKEDSYHLDSLNCPVFSMKVGVGYIIPIYPNDPVESYKDFSPEFCALIIWAVRMKADYIRLDRDGTKYSDLKTFDW
jgi:hypothetical protein